MDARYKTMDARPGTLVFSSRYRRRDRHSDARTDLGALYFYNPTGSQYEETLDFYFGLHTEQLVDNTYDANVGMSFSTTASEDALSTEATDDTELFLNLYLEDVGN